MNVYKIGADPEFFVRDADKKFVSAHGMIPGNKLHPHRVPLGAVQVDGMAVEFNIKPALSLQEWEENIRSVRTSLADMLPEGHYLSKKPVAIFSEEYMATQPLEALELGCEPDFNAWNCNPNAPPEPHPTMRTASGHIHIGWGKQIKLTLNHMATCWAIARQLDYLLGMPSLILDNDTKRREMYGKAGSFRPKPYGMEYRVLSNFWLKRDSYIKWVYDVALNTVRMVRENYLSSHMSETQKHEKYSGDEARIIINNHDDVASQTLLNHYDIRYPGD